MLLKVISIYKSTNFVQGCNFVCIAQLILLFILVPSFTSNELMQGTISGKMFFFIYIISIATIFFFLKYVVNTSVYVSFSYVDGVLILWIVYILVNSLLHNTPLSYRFFELLGLIFFYLLLRQVDLPKYGIFVMAIIIGAIIQAVQGNLQLWGYLPGHHAQFKITGSFFNPGPFAGYLSSVFPFILGAILFKKKFYSIFSDKFYYITIWIGGTFLLLAIAASHSRAAYMAIIFSTAMLLIKRYSIVTYFNKYTLTKKMFLLFFILLLGGSVFGGLIKMKTDSVNGRLFIWKVASDIIKEYPINGVGFDSFQTLYMEKQAAYFKENPNSPQEMVAGDTKYCFNELIQHTVENGVIGTILLTIIFISIFMTTNKKFEDELWMVKVGIGGIVIFGIFSYPTQILPIKINLIFYLAYIAELTKKRETYYFSLPQTIVFKCIPIICIIGISIVGNKILPNYYKAWKSWYLAYQLSQTGNYIASLSESSKAFPFLKNNGDFLTYYGKILTIAQQPKEAISILLQAKLYYPNIVIYTALGDNYAALEKNDQAEQAYFQAWYMNPSRFYPKYLLAKLYDKSGQSNKAIAVANELLNKPIKIQSTAVDEMQIEMRKILSKNNKRE